MLGEYLDWTSYQNTGRKRVGEVTLVVDHMRGPFISYNQYGLEVFHNKHIQFGQIKLSSTTLESACNEATDVYRALLTDAVEYLTKQVNLLPEI